MAERQQVLSPEELDKRAKLLSGYSSEITSKVQDEKEKKKRNIESEKLERDEKKGNEVIEPEGGLLYEGQNVVGGEKIFGRGANRPEAVQKVSGVPAELLRGKGPGRTESIVDNLEYDGQKGLWYETVGGVRIYKKKKE